VGARSAIAVVLALGACSFRHGVDPFAPTGDGKLPANCFGAEPYAVCLTALPTTSLSLGPDVVNTDESQCRTTTISGQVVVQPNGPKLCVFAGTSVTVVGALRASGALPLAIVATTGDLDVTAEIDVASHVGSSGAGANDPSCAISPPGKTADGASGGAGGSFGTRGGNGGSGNASGTPAGGVAPAASGTPMFVRGGCAGGAGGDGTGASPGDPGGAAGAGGGAVYLVAHGALSIMASIDASGAGGAGAVIAHASSKAAGGGAGSGGMIALFAGTTLTTGTVQIIANGGGGGGGGDDTSGGNGGESLTAGAVAIGGTGGPQDGKPGGIGAIATQDGQMGIGPGGGGGGGGGGVGVVKVVSGQSITASVSPPPS
jgi:hypothetical protein